MKLEGHGQLGTRLRRGLRADTQARRFRDDARGEGRAKFIWRITQATISRSPRLIRHLPGTKGEGDRTREWWLDAHCRHFTEQARREGFEFGEDLSDSAHRGTDRPIGDTNRR